MLAIIDNGVEYVFSKIGMEPTEAAFNSIKNLEHNVDQKPINPMINAGAIAIVSLICGDTAEEKFNRILKFTRKLQVTLILILMKVFMPLKKLLEIEIDH